MRISETYKNGVLWLSAKWGLNPYELDAVIFSESGRNPDARNPLPGQTAYGLIQFIAATRKYLIGTTETPISMGFQFRMIDMYFRKNNLPKFATGGQIYACIFMPALARKKVFAVRGTNIYSLNSGLDVNKDGYITIQDLNNRVSRIAAEQRKKINFGIKGEAFKLVNKIANNELF